MSVLLDVPANRYGNERLARLLRLLRPVPDGWVVKAKRDFLDARLRAPAPVGKPLTERDVARLRRSLEIDPLFRKRFDADPVAAAEAAGMPELAIGLEQEMRELVALAERIARDHAYRAELDADPVAALAGAGMPVACAEPLLHALALPDEILARVPEVVAHQHQQLPLKALLLMLLLGSRAAAEKVRAAARSA